MAASSLASTTKTPATIRATTRDEDLDAQGPSADLVRVYLNGIGKTALLTAEQEVDLASRGERHASQAKDAGGILYRDGAAG